MKLHHLVLGAFALGVTGIASGVWVSSNGAFLSGGFHGLVRPAVAQSTRGQTQDDPVLFYRDPMGERTVSARPRRDSMGMDFLPVRRSEVVPLLGRLPNPMPAPRAYFIRRPE